MATNAIFNEFIDMQENMYPSLNYKASKIEISRYVWIGIMYYILTIDIMSSTKM